MNRFFIACTLMGVLMSWTHSSVASGTSIERDNLGALTSTQIVIEPVPAWAEEHGATRPILRTMMETALTSGGLKISDITDDTGGVLDLTVEGFTGTNPDIYFYFTRLSVVQKVRLPNGRLTYAHTWQDEGFGATEKADKSTFLLVGSVTNSINKYISDFKESRSDVVKSK